MGLGVSFQDMRIIQYHPINKKEAKGKDKNNMGDMKPNKGKQGMIRDMGQSGESSSQQVMTSRGIQRGFQDIANSLFGLGYIQYGGHEYGPPVQSHEVEDEGSEIQIDKVETASTPTHSYSQMDATISKLDRTGAGTNLQTVGSIGAGQLKSKSMENVQGKFTAVEALKSYTGKFEIEECLLYTLGL
ncbi:hypothetical protein Taro_043165 [Colocasia esculenta]|uniref:Uncharacterized protein n=1 Tax=Colocasia esculenta TaxID=4460 RepID=A0A843WYB9_COLES|nr:hypothetical protein [Colocasia esculenta]